MENLEFIESGAISYEEFREDAWDYVSGKVVNTNYYEDNFDFINECTFDMYKMYCSKMQQDGLYAIEGLTIRDCGKILEFMFSNIIKFNQIK